MEYVEGMKEPREGEVILWTVATANLPTFFMPRKVKKAAQKAIDFIDNLEGFCGYHPMPPQGTLCLFDSENNAKAARNMMRAKGIVVGDNICQVYAPEATVKSMREQIRRYIERKK